MFASSEHMTGKPAARTPPPALLQLATTCSPSPSPSYPLRGIVPCTSIQQFTGVLPTPPNLTGSKVKEWNSAVTELKQYLENVQRAGTVSFPTTVTTELPRGPAAPVKVCSVQRGVGGVQGWEWPSQCCRQGMLLQSVPAGIVALSPFSCML